MQPWGVSGKQTTERTSLATQAPHKSRRFGCDETRTVLPPIQARRCRRPQCILLLALRVERNPHVICACAQAADVRRKCTDRGEQRREIQAGLPDGGTPTSTPLLNTAGLARVASRARGVASQLARAASCNGDGSATGRGQVALGIAVSALAFKDSPMQVIPATPHQRKPGRRLPPSRSAPLPTKASSGADGPTVPAPPDTGPPAASTTAASTARGNLMTASPALPCRRCCVAVLILACASTSLPTGTPACTLGPMQGQVTAHIWFSILLNLRLTPDSGLN